MSIAVELTKLHEAIGDTDRAPYFLTVGDDGRAHCVAVDWHWHDDELALSVGNRTLANSRARSLVSLVWPPSERDGHSLIVDGEVTHTAGAGNGDNLVRVRPTRAVLHRPAQRTLLP
jgi:hypothetical protein